MDFDKSKITQDDITPNVVRIGITVVLAISMILLFTYIIYTFTTQMDSNNDRIHLAALRVQLGLELKSANEIKEEKQVFGDERLTVCETV